jgi:hypothetical protein
VLIGFGYYTNLGQQTKRARQAGMVRQLCNSLYPNFNWPDNNRDTTQTFHFLLSGMVVFGSILIVWSIGAGAMRASWLLSLNPMSVHDFAGVGKSCGSDGCTMQIWLFTLLQIVRAIGGAVLICVAGGLAFGFLFGIPHQIATNNPPPASTDADKDKAKANYALSTNLTQVSDWLTKVIVGVSLVEVQNAYTGFVNASTAAADWLFMKRHGSPAVLGAALGGGAVFGFLFFYIYTQLILSRLIDAAQRALAVGISATKSLLAVAATDRPLVPPIRRTASPNDAPQEPSAEQYKAAMAYYGVSFNELISNPSVSNDQVLSWARARALLNDYKSAALAYFYLLGRENS